MRLELQDLEADEDQPQHTASPRTQPIINGYQASTSSQFFRSHPHHRQHQEHQQQPVSVYRQQQQPSYQPVASTSGSSGPSAAALNARKPRPSSARSSSPVVSRTSSSISNTLVQQRQPQQQQQYHDNAISRPSSSTSVSHRRITDINDAERTQESIPLASSSSIPNSPEARFSPDIALPPAVEVLSTENRSSSTVDSTPPPSISAVDTPLSNTSTAVSPLTRLQAKRERERHHDRRSRTHGLDTTNGGQSSSAAVAAGVKRRWTAALLPEHHTINLSMNLGNTVVEGMQDGEASEGEDVDEDDEASDFSGQGVQQPSTGQRKSSTTNLNVAPPQEDDMGMETDDTSYRIDGNARPIKRTARR